MPKVLPDTSPVVLSEPKLASSTGSSKRREKTGRDARDSNTDMSDSSASDGFSHVTVPGPRSRRQTAPGGPALTMRLPTAMANLRVDTGTNAARKAALRFTALSALPGVEEAPLHRLSLAFEADDVERRFQQYRSLLVPRSLLWRVVGSCLICISATITYTAVYDGVNLGLVAACLLYALWACTTCLVHAKPAAFNVGSCIFCALLTVSFALQLAAPVKFVHGQAYMMGAGGLQQLLPWAALIPLVYRLPWLWSVVCFITHAACLLITTLIMNPDTSDIMGHSIAIWLLAVFLCYRSARLERRVWYLEFGSPAAHARKVAEEEATHPPREPSEFEVPMSRVVDLLNSAHTREREPNLCHALQSCLDVVYTHGNFVPPADVQRRMVQQAMERGTDDPTLNAWLSKELLQQRPMLSKLGKSRQSLQSTRRMHMMLPKRGRDTGVRTKAVPPKAAVVRTAPQVHPLKSFLRAKSDGVTARPSGKAIIKAQVEPSLDSDSDSKNSDDATESEGGVRLLFQVPHLPLLPSISSLAPSRVLQAEQHVTDWAFDVLDWSKECKQPLVWVTETLLMKFGIMQKHHLQPGMVRSFLQHMEQDYCLDTKKRNPYHNHIHGAFVVQAVGHFLTVTRIATVLHDLDALAILMAAACHDFRHPGVNSNFLVTTESKLAVRYNDISVLEKFHCAETFTLLRKPSCDVLGIFTKEKRAHIRYVIIQCVLATDLAHGHKFATEFKGKVRRDGVTTSDDDKLLLMQILLKCADVSHPARPLRIHKQWSSLIAEEFYRQGDQERSRGLRISPLCDRFNANIPRSQRGFISYVCQGIFATFGRFCHVDMWSEMLRLNKAYWRSQEEQVLADEQRSARLKGEARLSTKQAGSDQALSHQDSQQAEPERDEVVDGPAPKRHGSDRSSAVSSRAGYGGSSYSSTAGGQSSTDRSTAVGGAGVGAGAGAVSSSNGPRQQLMKLLSVDLEVSDDSDGVLDSDAESGEGGGGPLVTPMRRR